MLAEGVRFERIGIRAAPCNDSLRAKGDQILEKHPNIKQREFCRKLKIGNQEGGHLYRTLTGKQKQHRNTD